MMLIPCPWCGPRSEDEFHCGGEASRRRPTNPDTLSDQQWADYLYGYDNHKGWVRERWWHVKGCAHWFEIERHNVSHCIRSTSNAVAVGRRL